MGVEAALIGGSLGGAAIGAFGNMQAADAAADASDRAIAEQRRQFDLILGLTQPQRDVGNAALNVLAGAFIPGYGQTAPAGANGPAPANALVNTGAGVGAFANNPYLGLGLPEPVGAAGAFGFADGMVPGGGGGVPRGTSPDNALSLADQFAALPGAQFIMDENFRNIGNSFAARGGATSGNALRALQDRGTEITNSLMFDRLFQLAGFGPPATNTASSAASSTGANIGNALIGAGNARASGISGAAQSINNGLQGGLSNYLLAQQLSQPAAPAGAWPLGGP